MWQADYMVEEGENSLKVYHKLGLGLRLVGVPLLIIAGKLLYDLLRSIYDSIIWGEMLLVFPGTLLLIALILGFGVPGWLLTFMNKSVTIDRGQGEVIDIKDYLVHKRVRRYPLAALRKVTVTRGRRKYERASGSTETRPVYPIELIGQDGQKVLVGELEERELAKELGRQIAEMIGVEVEVDIRRLQGISA